MTDSRNQPELETLSYKPTIAELEDILEKGGSSSIEIMPNGEIQAAKKSTNCICKSYHNRTGEHINGCPEQPANTPVAILGFNSHVIKPETRLNKAEDAGKTVCKTCKGFNDKYCVQTGTMIPCPDCKPESPNQNLMIIAEIEGLMSQVNEKLGKIPIGYYIGSVPRRTVLKHVLEEIDHFKTTLVDLRKAFE